MKLNKTTNFNNDAMTGGANMTYLFGEYEEVPGFVVIAFVLGALITLSNLPVVISSGLILKKGKKPKTTYILLGNVSLADALLGLTIVFGVSFPTKSHDPGCILLIGLLVCPAMVSIFSVGLIAIDRYIYIIHGLYYERWFSTRRVRYGILLIWITAIILSFSPGFGWINKQPYSEECYYITLFPEELILLNSILSIIPIIVVVVLYSIILVKALKTVKNINETCKNYDKSKNDDKPKLRMYRGTINGNKNVSLRTIGLRRSVSFDMNSNITNQSGCRSMSTEDLTQWRNKEAKVNMYLNNEMDSKSSVFTTETFVSQSTTDEYQFEKSDNQKGDEIVKSQITPKTKRRRNSKEPNKWRAITVVILTSGSFVITWIPFFVTVTIYVFCDNKNGSKCLYYGDLSSRSLCILGFCNSLLNPLIYAWWHKGFQRSVKFYYKKLFQKK